MRKNSRSVDVRIKPCGGYPTDMDRRKELVRRAYEETAAAFAAARRSGGAEAPWLERFMLGLPVGAPVVDLGCGNGEPIARTLAAAGFAVTGIDFSPEQVRRAIAHVPSGRFVVADMATVELESGKFRGVIAWDSVFHLPAEEHARLFARVRRWLIPGGQFIVTLGGTGGEVYTEHLGAATYYSALDVETAVRTITAAGFLVQECLLDDPGDHGHLVVVAIASS
jgi:SAM-dependent methyltransferase